jgi:beta-1,4-mannooligosaccharide/beta-1,4-mannosyl-N-acetylglucosamine phosphorylase
MVPYPATLVFNAGVVKWNGRYIMVFRNDYGLDEAEFRSGMSATSEGPPFRTNLGFASSDDGVIWTVAEQPCWDWSDHEVYRVYDPRLTILDGQPHLCFAADTRHGIRGGIARTDDFRHFEVLSLSVPDNRNMVLFPEKVDGRYVRLERPFPVYGRGGMDRFDLWISRSPDLIHWGDSELLLSIEDVPFANDKIGPAAPPVRTSAGWLTSFHAVWKTEQNLGGWESSWHKRYTTGFLLLKLDDPSIILARSLEPVFQAELSYEKKGFRNDVIFPGGMILEPDGELKLYYGAADAVTCLASAQVEKILDSLVPVENKVSIP